MTTLSTEQTVGKLASTRSPLWGVLAVLVFACLFLWWSIGTSHAAEELARRNTQNVARAIHAATDLVALMPPLVTPTANSTPTQRVSGLIDQILHDAAVNDRALRSQSIHSLGSVGQTAVSREQERIELSGLSLKQAGTIVDALERAELPLWVESADLTPAGGQGWSFVLEINWLETTAR